MPGRGTLFGLAVLAGMGLSESLLPVGRTSAIVACATAAVATIGDGRAWPLLATGLGFLRATVASEDFEARAIRRPSRHEGMFEVVGEAVRGVVVRADGRRLYVAEPPPGLPGPGYRGRALLRLDPLRSRGEPSAFRAERWAAARDFHARARVIACVEDVQPAPGPAAAGRRLASRIRESGRRLLGFGRSSAGDLATALLLGDRRGLDEEIRGDFRHAGLAHVLALSGAHLAVLALGFGTLLRTARFPHRPVAIGTLAFVIAYTALTGAGAPLVRACTTVALATLAGLGGRRSRPVDALGWAGSAILLARPAWRHDAGFRLSFLATGVLALAAARAAPGPGSGLRGRVRALGTAVGVSALVTLGTVPELAESFGRISLLAPITNVVAGPPCAAVLGWGGLAVLGPWPEAASRVLAEAATRSAAILLAVVRVAGAWPGGNIALPALPASLVFLVLALARRLALGGRPGRIEIRLAIAASLAAGASFLPRDRLTVLDVGQGDAVLVEGAGGAVLVDAGPPGREGYESAAAPAVGRRRIRPLDAVVLTHGHVDHFGGIDDLLRRGRLRGLVLGPHASDHPPELVARTVSGGGRVRAVADSLALLGGRLEVRWPFPGGVPLPPDENDRSLAILWRAGAAAADLLGDAGPATHEALRQRGLLAPAPILLIPHHGSRHQTDEELLTSVRCRLAIVSCGMGNPHGHPHRETLERLRRSGIALLRTDRDGTITLTATRGGFRVRWERDWPGPRHLFPSFPLPGRPAIP